MLKTNLKGIVDKIEIREIKYGILDRLGRVAVLSPREQVRKQDHSKYDELVMNLKEKGYKVIYTPSETPKELSRDRMYDILASHQTSTDLILWSQTELKETKYIR